MASDPKAADVAPKVAPLPVPTSEKRVLKDKDDLLRRDMILLLRASVAEGSKLDNMDVLNEFQPLDDLPQINTSDFEQDFNCKILPTDSSETHGAKDFSPRVFCRLRRMWGIKAEHYLQSWAFTDTTVPMSALSPQDSKKEMDKKKAPSSKDEYSGPLEKNSTKSSFFIYSHDRRFLIKSLTLAEAVNLRSMLPRYYIYMRYNPHSILTRIVGHHLLTVGSKRIPFCVQQNILPSPIPPLNYFECYDLKGQKSRAKKPTSSDKKRSLKMQVLKEGDFNRKLVFATPEVAQTFTSQLKKDLQFLVDEDCVEYSFLLGVHTDTSQASPVQEKRATKIVFFTRNTTSKRGRDDEEPSSPVVADSDDVGVVISSNGAGNTSPAVSPSLPLRSVLRVREKSGYKTKAKTNPEMFRITGSFPQATERSLLRRTAGGVPGYGQGMKPEIYYLGLIDILKKSEKKRDKNTAKKKDEETEASLYAQRLDSYLQGYLAVAPGAVTALEALTLPPVVKP